MYACTAKWLCVISLALSTLACTATHTAPMPTVTSLDVPSYMGVWYQQALIPNRFQKMCVADTQAFYALQNNGDVTVTNRCRKSDGQIERATGIAKTVEGSFGAKLRVSFFRPFYGDYWVLALNPNPIDGWVLVGEPSRRYAWIMSRSPHLSRSVLMQVMDKAVLMGYSRQQFVDSPQTQPLSTVLD